MAAITSFTSLAVPAPDDTMEMSSPARLPHDDDDIEIDFDDYQAPRTSPMMTACLKMIPPDLQPPLTK